MRITERGVSRDVLRAAIDSAARIVRNETAGNVFASGDLPNITLRTRDSNGPGSRRSASGRRTCGASWEAHRIFLDSLFSLRPAATVRTSLTTYRGAADFLRTFKRTGESQVRSAGVSKRFRDL